ncbi:MAG: peptidoglycan-binding protein [Candidatus Sungbacteria bacterium]|nr:peptidoglycan-binding protein [Candidatus Sungbacteria bacterium]
MNIKSRVVAVVTTVALSGVAAVVPLAAVADHTTAHTIEQLTAQIAALQSQLAALAGGAAAAPAAVAGKCSFTRSLTVGARGDDVTCLQNYLTGTGHFTYSGGSTGYFGGVTKAAVAAWQAANSVSPAVGYFGPLSRAKYDSMVAAAPAAPAAGETPAVSVPVGSGLTVSAPAEQPAATLAPQSATRVPFTKAIFTASADGDVKITSVTVERRGLAADAAFSGIMLLDEDGTQIGTTKTLTSDHNVKLTDGLTIKAGTSRTVTIAGEMGSSLSGQSGQVARLAITAVDAGSTTVNGALPIEGNGMTINSTLTVGSITMSIGSLDPGSANTKNVGTKGYYLASVKASVGSAEDLTFERIRFNQAGSAGKADLTNVVVRAADKDYPATVSADGKYYEAKFPDGLKVKKGGFVEFSMKADLVDGSSRTVDMNLLRKSDVVAKGDTFGYYILPGGGSSGTASAGAFSSNLEPFFNAYVATINLGSLTVSNSNKVPATNIPVDTSDTVIGGFLLDVKGEDVQISNFTMNFTFSGSGTSSDITSAKLVNSNGSILAGPKDPASGVVQFTDTWTVPVGENHITVKAKLDTSFVSNDTVRVSVDPDDQITAKGMVTGLTITPSPTSGVTANTQTVKAGALNLSVSPTPFGQSVVRGVNQYHFATIVADAGNSGEDVRVTTLKLRDTLSANTVGDEINTCTLFDGATALTTGSDVQSPSDPSGTTNDITWTLTNGLVVTKGTVKKVDLKCNISSSAAANSFHQWGLNDTSAHNVTGAVTGNAITEGVTTSTGSIMSIRTAGTFTVLKDSSSPVDALTIAGKTDVPMLVLKYHAAEEPVNIQELTLTYSSTTASTSDFLKVTLWDGATKVGEAVWAGSTSQFATSTLTSNFIVPKDGDKLLTVKVDLASISVTASTTAGRLLSIDYNGTSSSSGVGVDSGQKLGSGSSGSIQGGVLQLMKSIPTFAKLAVPSTTLPQSNAILYRFSITADAAGPVALYKFTFLTSSSSGSATSSAFDLYAYSDSGFSTQAYSRNPVNSAQNVDCAGLSTLQDDTNGCGTASATLGGSYATSTVGATGALDDEIVFFFTPVQNTASTTEAIVVPAGGTRYFELRGNVTLATAGSTGNTIQFGLAGDAARPLVKGTGSNFVTALGAGAGAYHDAGRGRLGTAAIVAEDHVDNDFVWSPMSTSTSVGDATSTTDWTNGYLVPGLPSTNMSVNSFSN